MRTVLDISNLPSPESQFYCPKNGCAGPFSVTHEGIKTSLSGLGKVLDSVDNLLVCTPMDIMVCQECGFSGYVKDFKTVAI